MKLQLSSDCSTTGSDDSSGGQDKEVVFSEKVTYLTFGDYPAMSSGPVEHLAFAPDQEGILLTVHGPGSKASQFFGATRKVLLLENPKTLDLP